MMAAAIHNDGSLALDYSGLLSTAPILLDDFLGNDPAELAALTITSIHNDALNSPVAATDAQGQLLWSEHFQPFGEPRDKPAAQSQPKIGLVSFRYRIKKHYRGLSNALQKIVRRV